LFGGTGPDLLYGRAGQDAFVFNTRPNGTHNVDTIKDFRARDDMIWLDDIAFKAIGHPGTASSLAHLNAKFFWTGGAAHDSNDHVIYDPSSGSLFYDPDGTGASAQVRIAQLGLHLKITAKDFFVV
jgi:serralysin